MTKTIIFNPNEKVEEVEVDSSKISIWPETLYRCWWEERLDWTTRMLNSHTGAQFLTSSQQ